MSWIENKILSGLGDMGDFIPSAPITFPIRYLMRRDAERSGIDTHNPRRSLASCLASVGMSAALAATLGSPGGILGGLLGYVLAMGSNYKGDRHKIACKVEEEVMYLAELEALQIAAEITESFVDRETWNEICKEIYNEIEGMSNYLDQPKSLSSAVDVMIEVVYGSIKNIDYEAHLVFSTSYEEAKQEISLLP